MKYMGSKARHTKELLSVILRVRQPTQLFVEPFVGGANILAEVTGPRLGADIDHDLIALWQAVSSGWIPPRVFTEEQYKHIKYETTSPLKGYAAFALSYGGKKFGGWRRDRTHTRNYADEAYRNAQIQFPKLRGVKFRCCEYSTLVIPHGSVVYCDPPYAHTTRYTEKFDHTKFWVWCRETAKMNVVFVSEYSAPPDFVCVWEKAVTSSLTANTGGKRATERLFIVGRV